MSWALKKRVHQVHKGGKSAFQVEGKRAWKPDVLRNGWNKSEEVGGGEAQEASRSQNKELWLFVIACGSQRPSPSPCSQAQEVLQAYHISRERDFHSRPKGRCKW